MANCGRVNRRYFDRLVGRAVRTIPRKFRRYLDNVLITVQDYPDRELLEEQGADSLLGIYLGVPITERHPDDLHVTPDRIIIFQRPIEEMCRTPEEIVREVRITVVHEIGHHFGLDEDEIVAAIGE